MQENVHDASGHRKRLNFESKPQLLLQSTGPQLPEISTKYTWEKPKSLQNLQSWHNKGIYENLGMYLEISYFLPDVGTESYKGQVYNICMRGDMSKFVRASPTSASPGLCAGATWTEVFYFALSYSPSSAASNSRNYEDITSMTSRKLNNHMCVSQQTNFKQRPLFPTGFLQTEWSWKRC